MIKKILLALSLMCAPLFTQELGQPVFKTLVLVSQSHQVIQYGFLAGANGFFPNKQRKNYKFSLKYCGNGCMQVQTVGGVSKIYIQSFEPGCENGCVFAGTFDNWAQTHMQVGNGYYWDVVARGTGTLNDVAGTHENTDVMCEWETYPSGWTDELTKPQELGPSSCTVIISLN